MSKRVKTNNQIIQSQEIEINQFKILPEAPKTHKYFSTSFQGLSLKVIQKENKILQDCLPPNIWVRTYENKINLYSIMISGPIDTPYEHGLFIFDAVLPANYPTSPPLFHYYSYCQNKINPNLYTSGLVCISLLETWGGTGCERWTNESTLLQVIVSIQGLVLVKEPYYNEPGFSKNFIQSKKYNEETIRRVIKSIIAMMKKSDTIFEKEIKFVINKNKNELLQKIAYWISDVMPMQTRKRKHMKEVITSYPLLPLYEKPRLKGLENLLKLELEQYIK